MNTKVIFIVAFVAIFLGIASLTGMFSSPPPAQPQKEVKVVEPDISFWVARHPVTRGTLVSPADFTHRVLPASAAQAQGVSQDQDVHFDTDMIARNDIADAQVIQQNDFLTPTSPDYIATITPEGKIPYPITVDTAELQTMNIRPSNKVDVMLLSSPGSNVNAQQSTMNQLSNLSVSMLFKAITVIAINKNSSSEESSLLVALDQDQVAKLIISRRIGKIYLFHAGSQTLPTFNNISVREVLPDYSSVRELRGSATPNQFLNSGTSR